MDPTKVCEVMARRALAEGFGPGVREWRTGQDASETKEQEKTSVEATKLEDDGPLTPNEGKT